MPRQTIADADPRSRCVQYVLSCLVLILFFISSAKANPWETLAPGVEYRDVGVNLLTPWSHVHVFRIDLTKNQLDLITAKEIDRSQASVDQFAHRAQALIAINGGFFDKNYHPLGLRIGHHHQYSPLKQISWWGIFYVLDHVPHLSGFSHYSPDQSIDFAVQSGPRLLVKVTIPPLKPGHAERTALGITHDGRLIMLVTDHAFMTTTELARLMKSFPLYCVDALNLDGGSSSQLYAHMGAFQLNAHGFSDVSDAIVIKPLGHDSH